MHRYPIAFNFVSGQCIAAARIQQGIIGVQIAALKLKQPNLGSINPGFFAVIHTHTHSTGAFLAMSCIILPFPVKV